MFMQRLICKANMSDRTNTFAGTGQREFNEETQTNIDTSSNDKNQQFQNYLKQGQQSVSLNPERSIESQPLSSNQSPIFEKSASITQLHQKQQQQLFQQLQIQKQQQQQQQQIPQQLQQQQQQQLQKQLHQQQLQQQQQKQQQIQQSQLLQQHQQYQLQPQGESQTQGSQFQTQRPTPPQNSNIQLQGSQSGSRLDADVNSKKRLTVDAPQFNQQNTEKFLSFLEQYMKKLNKPFTRYPSVGNTRINLFVLYYIVSSFGGFVKAYQEQKFPVIAGQLGIPKSDQKLYNDLLQCYYANLFPFEQYARSAEGMRRYTQQQQQQQQQQQKQKQNTIETQSQHLEKDNRRNVKVEEKQEIQQSPNEKQLPILVNPTSTQQAHLLATASNTLPTEKTQRHSISPDVSSVVQQNLQTEPKQLKISQTEDVTSNISSAAAKIAKPKSLGKVKTRLSKNPTILKNYLPFTTINDSPGGVDLLDVEKFGEQLDDMKPVFLYFPELGNIDLKALALSLSSGITAEINVALNVLLIISSDLNVQVPFDKCTILLDSLAALGVNLIEKLSISNCKKDAPILVKVLSKEPNSISTKRIDSVFEKYTKNSDGPDYTIEVDSFTSEITRSNAPQNNFSKIETQNVHISSTKADSKATPKSQSTTTNTDFFSMLVENFTIPNYLNILHECRNESDDFDFNIYEKSYFDQKIVMIEELSTISLILRNFSFSSNNNLHLARNEKYMNFLYTLIFAAASSPNMFYMTRKRLSLMKDTLVVLSNIGHAIDLKSDMELWLILCLCFAFGSRASSLEKGFNFLSGKYDPIRYKYHGHAVDVISKVICSSLLNKRKFENLLRGDISDSLVKKMVIANFGEKVGETGVLFKEVFSLLLSSIPSDTLHQGIDPLKEIFPTCIEAVLASLIMTEILKSSTFNSNIALQILLSEENFGMILQKLTFIYGAVYVNMKEQGTKKHILFASHCAELANILIKLAIDYSIASETTNEDIPKLNSIPRLFGDDDNHFGLIVAPVIPDTFSQQIIENFKVCKKLESLANSI